VDGPDVRVIPWFNIFFFIFAVVAFLFLRAMWRQFLERTVDPAIQDMGERVDAVGDAVSEKRGRVRRWLDTWRK
jgi:membrane protein implicated in regulation of membrane protease activity